MLDKDRNWMTYITDEVKAACTSKGWGYQIRRKWSVRDRPVAESPIDDYEWKLIPDADGELQEAPPDRFDEGIYYILGFDRSADKFILQHDTSHCGMLGSHWSQTTYTEIRMARERSERGDYFCLSAGSGLQRCVGDLPPQGWLGSQLLDLTSRFGPNHFSIT